MDGDSTVDNHRQYSDPLFKARPVFFFFVKPHAGAQVCRRFFTQSAKLSGLLEVALMTPKLGDPIPNF